MSVISTIPQYIQQFSDEEQRILNVLYQFVQSIVPEQTTEIITYKMPTFRFNGNLFHFALNKKHIGLYPGSEAINHYQPQLKNYKCTKGAIQIPIDINLPFQLIEDLIAFNVEILKQKTGPNWYVNRGNWEEAELFMQDLIVKLPLEKSFKWGTDIYTYQNKNVIAWGGFKNFFSLWFYNGVFLTDPYQVLISASEGKTKALRQWRFTDVKDMNEQKILQYIKESIQTIIDGKELVPEKTGEVEIAGVLKEYLNKDANLQTCFNALTKGKRKEYVEYINEAKQEKTKQSRLEKIKPLILSGKGLNDKYKSK